MKLQDTVLVVLCIAMLCIWYDVKSLKGSERFAEIDNAALKEYNDFADQMKAGGYSVPGNIHVGGNLSAGTTSRIGKHGNEKPKPKDFSGGMGFGFTRHTGGGGYQDWILLNGWYDTSGGHANLLTFRKNTPGLRIYHVPQNANNDITHHKGNYHDVVTFKNGELYANGSKISALKIGNLDVRSDATQVNNTFILNGWTGCSTGTSLKALRAQNKVSNGAVALGRFNENGKQYWYLVKNNGGVTKFGSSSISDRGHCTDY